MVPTHRIYTGREIYTVVRAEGAEVCNIVLIMELKRIQRKRVKGWKMPENTVYVGRPTKWGNPFRVEED